MAYNTTASFNKLSCSDYVDFGKCPDKFGRFFASKIGSNYLNVKLELSKKNDNNWLLLEQNLTMGETDFKRIMRLRNQLVIAAENLPR